MNIVAIGGGKKGPAIEYALENLTDRSEVLVIPSPCNTQDSHDKKLALARSFFNRVGIPDEDIDVLHAFAEKPSQTKLEEAFGKAALLFVTGGNTPYMLRTMEAHGSDIKIRQAIADGKVLSGTSAGALLPFRTLQILPISNPKEVTWDFEYTTGFGLIPTAMSVHAQKHEPIPGDQVRNDSRLEAFLADFPENEELGYAIDNDAALIFSGGQVHAIRADRSANAYLVTRDGEDVRHEKL